MLVDTVADLTREDYEIIRRLIYEKSGINLGDQKMQLVRARLGKRVRELELPTYRAYIERVRRDKTGAELSDLLDAISTNTTHLFRENRHFDFLRDTLNEWAAAARQRGTRRLLRIWSAGCSAGDEPYTVAMVADDTLRAQDQVQFKILATDISGTMLERAKDGVYEPSRLGTVPEGFRKRYFTAIGRGAQTRMQVARELRELITFARFNLMNKQFPFRNRFDLIFCRNVMIYFDRPTQAMLVNRFAGHLAPGGFLLIGHSESLNSLEHPLSYVQPTIYRKPPDS